MICIFSIATGDEIFQPNVGVNEVNRDCVGPAKYAARVKKKENLNHLKCR